MHYIVICILRDLNHFSFFFIIIGCKYRLFTVTDLGIRMSHDCLQMLIIKSNFFFMILTFLSGLILILIAQSVMK